MLDINKVGGYSIRPQSGHVRVECPDCGSSGASSYPCTCHMCDNKTLMLPVIGNHKTQNWNEVFNKCQ